MKDNYETLALSQPQDHVLQVVLSRPRAANAMNTQMGRDLYDLFSSLVLDPGEWRCIVLTGAGEKVFCAGGDLKERDGMSDADWQRQHQVFEQAVYRLKDCPVPIIAAVNGAAYGGGCEIALMCDFAYASDNARFALTEATLGIIPGAGGTQNLPRAIGTRRAKQMIFSGRPASAQQALDWGIVNGVVPLPELMPSVLEIAGAIAEAAPLAVRRAKQAIDLGIGTDLKTGFGIEIEAYNRLVPSEDRREGVRAFNERRKPRYVGR